MNNDAVRLLRNKVVRAGKNLTSAAGLHGEKGLAAVNIRAVRSRNKPWAGKKSKK